MADPSIPQNLPKIIRDLQRDVRNLQLGAQLGHSSIRGGKLRILGPDGTPILTSGELDSGLVATEVYAPDGTVVARFGEITDDASGVMLGYGLTRATTDTWLIASQDGMSLPRIPWHWAKFNDPKDVTSGTFTTVHEATIEVLTWPTISGRFQIDTDAGTEGEVRLQDLGTGNTTNTITVPSSGDLITVHIGWNISAWATVGAGPYFIRMQVRRTSGSGAVHAYNPSSVCTGTAGFEDAGGLGILE